MSANEVLRAGVARAALLLVLLAGAAACGQKGDLYLPEPPPVAGGDEDGEDEDS